MRLIHVTYKAEEYGIGTFLYSLLLYQKDDSEITKVGIVFNATGPSEINYKKIGINVYSLGFSNAKNVRAFIRFIKIFKAYDIVNLHSFSPWAFFAGLILRKKIIYSFHGALGLRGGIQDLFVRLFHKFFINRFCHKITFASRASLNRYLEGFTCPIYSNKMVIFPYGMKIKNIESSVTRSEMRKKLNLGKRFVIGTASRIDPYKRLEKLLYAFACLSDPTEFQLLILGEGDQKYKEYLFQEVNRLKIGKYISFLGFRGDVLDVINTMDLFVLPTKNEPFGLALLEAMALGIPCAVFSEGGGAVEIIGESGFVVNDTKELGAIIMRLHHDPELAASISIKVKERACKFDIKYTAEKLAEIYKVAMH